MVLQRMGGGQIVFGTVKPIRLFLQEFYRLGMGDLSCFRGLSQGVLEEEGMWLLFCVAGACDFSKNLSPNKAAHPLKIRDIMIAYPDPEGSASRRFFPSGADPVHEGLTVQFR
jgi:hypothetical protein